MAMNYLEQRRRELRMPIPALAVRSGVPLSTVKRVLSGGLDRVAFGTVKGVAKALGVRLPFVAADDAQTYQEQQAKRKANRIAKMVQGTSALEAQAIPDEALERMVRRTTVELVAGSTRRLWAE